MKTITLALAALLCTTSAVQAGDGAAKAPAPIEQAVSQVLLGKDAVAQIRDAYNNGQYDAFLKESEAAYQEAIENNHLQSLAAMRTGAPIDAKWNEGAKALLKERNQDLLAVVDGQETLFASQVRSAADSSLSAEQEEAIAYLASLRAIAPNTGKNSDENALVDLDLEYEYKAIHLDVPLTQGGSVENRIEKHYVLKMEKMDKMLSASQSFKDAQAKKYVELAAQAADCRMAQTWDQTALTSLLKGKTKPADATEEKVLAHLQSHQDKVNELVRQAFQNQLDNHEAKK